MPATLHKTARRFAKTLEEPEEEIEQDLEDEDEDEEAESDEASDDAEGREAEEEEEEEDESQDDESQDEEDEEQLDEEDQPVQKTLVRLTSEINDCHKQIRKCDRRAVKFALQAGELLLQAKRRLGHGRWSQWLEEFVELSERQVQRYTKLFRSRAQLDALDPDWASTKSLGEALALIATPRREEEADSDEDEAEEEELGGEEEGQDDAESSTEDDEEEEQDETEEDNADDGDQEDEEDEEEDDDPARRQAKYRADRKAHTERCRRFDEFLGAEYLTFGRKGNASAALDTLTAVLVKAARRAARSLVSPEMKAADFDADFVARALVARLLGDGDVHKLFAPPKP